MNKRKQYSQLIEMDESQSYDLLMEWADENDAIPYITNKLNKISTGIPHLGVKGAANIIVCAIGKGFWQTPEYDDREDCDPSYLGYDDARYMAIHELGGKE